VGRPHSLIVALRRLRRVGFPQRDPRVDAFIETYVEWREECAALETAYQRWVESRRPNRDLAFSAYRAALDREEKAACVYGLVARSLGRRGSG
jgi:hypothetical protein